MLGVEPNDRIESTLSPLLSVVLPTYGVEDYLAACLDSILQINSLLEVIVVNDCSPDLAPEIARSYASIDPRVVVIDNEKNLGLGASRNVGARAARGDYLFFADSDDLVVPGAIDRMVATLESTRSDFATAPADEFGRLKYRKRYWTTTAPVYRRGAIRTTVEENPELIQDHTAWTKVFRSVFWMRNKLEWAEGVKCEDVRASSSAYALAQAVDVIPAVAYLYRRRPGSITSTLSDDKVIGDWARETLGALENISGVQSAFQEAMRKVISVELRSRVAVYQRGLSPAEDESFKELLNFLAQHSSVETLDNCDPQAREVVEGIKPDRTTPAQSERYGGELRDPLLSIVMPTYNVADWVGDTIRSILEGTWQRFELLIVDDGSSDQTIEIAEHYQNVDSRIRVLKSPGSGGAQARNFGASCATGEFIIFVDGDDLIPRRAFEELLGCLTNSGSDMAVGDFQKFWPTSTWRNSKAFGLDERRIGTNLIRTPRLIANRTCWNRMFRTAFYKEASIHFPSSPRANDILPMTLAMRLASRIDVVPEIVYHYRARSGSSSMTSALGTAESLAGYFRQESLCAAVLPDPCPLALAETYWHTSLGVDGWGNLKKFLEAYSPEVDSQEVSGVFTDLWSQRPSALHQIIGDHKSVVYHMLAKGDIDSAKFLFDMERKPKNRENATKVAKILVKVDDVDLIDSVLRLFHDWVLRPVIDDKSEWITDHVQELVDATAELSGLYDLQEAAVPETREPQVAKALTRGDENGLWRIIRATDKSRRITLRGEIQQGTLHLKRPSSAEDIVGVEFVEKLGRGRKFPVFFTGSSMRLTGAHLEQMAGAKWMPVSIEKRGDQLAKLPTSISMEGQLKKAGRFRVSSDSVQILHTGVRRIEESIAWRLRKTPENLVTRLIQQVSRKDS